MAINPSFYCSRKIPNRKLQLVTLCLLVISIFGIYKNSIVNHSVHTASASKLQKDRIHDNLLLKRILSTDASRLNQTSIKIRNDTEIIFIVVSAVDEFAVRSDIRSTWAHPNSSLLINKGRGCVIFGLGLNEKYRDRVQEEYEKNQDVLVVDVTDTYKNLVYKLLAIYKWINSTFPNAAIVKIDSDVIAQPDQISNLILSRPFYEPKILCTVHYGVVSNRNINDKWYISDESYQPDVLPEYCSGPLYILFPFTVEKLFKKIPSTTICEVEDAYITGILAQEANVTRVDITNFLVQELTEWNCEPKPAGFLLHTTKIKNVRTLYPILPGTKCLSNWKIIRKFLNLFQ